MSEPIEDTRRGVPVANAHICPGCKEEYDPRRRHRGMATEDGYCGLMCALADADGEYDD